MLVPIVAVLAAPAAPAATDVNLKVYISVDMEGVAGAVSGDQLEPGGFEYERIRTFMTAEAMPRFVLRWKRVPRRLS